MPDEPAGYALGTTMADPPRSRGPTRGRSDAITDVREVEDDDDVEYLPETEEVRYVSAYRQVKPHDELEPGEEVERSSSYATTPENRWGTTKCVEAAARRAAERVSEVLDTEDVAWAVTSRVDGHDRAALVDVTTLLGRDGTVASTPDVDFDALVEATPRTVSARYELEGLTCEMDVPVYASHTVVRPE